RLEFSVRGPWEPSSSLKRGEAVGHQSSNRGRAGARTEAGPRRRAPAGGYGSRQGGGAARGGQVAGRDCRRNGPGQVHRCTDRRGDGGVGRIVFPLSRTL